MSILFPSLSLDIHVHRPLDINGTAARGRPRAPKAVVNLWDSLLFFPDQI